MARYQLTLAGLALLLAGLTPLSWADSICLSNGQHIAPCRLTDVVGEQIYYKAHWWGTASSLKRSEIAAGGDTLILRGNQPPVSGTVVYMDAAMVEVETGQEGSVKRFRPFEIADITLGASSREIEPREMEQMQIGQKGASTRAGTTSPLRVEPLPSPPPSASPVEQKVERVEGVESSPARHSNRIERRTLRYRTTDKVDKPYDGNSVN